MAARPDESRRPHLTRRRFLQTTAASATTVALGRGSGVTALPSAQAAPRPPLFTTTQLSEHLSVYHGPINVGIVHNGPRALLVDCGDGSIRGKTGSKIKRVAQLVFTHHHRDQACGARPFVATGARVGVPADERDYFANPAAYWQDDKNLWRVYRSFRPHSLMLTEPLPVDEAYVDGQQFEFAPAKIRVINTPGHTDGAVSYLVDVDGQRVAFCGDCIYDEGQVWDLYSLQKGFSKGGSTVGGYHGFMGDRWQLVESLTRIKGQNPQLLVPAHGNLMGKPAEAIDSLVERLETCYEKYAAISALRYYFPQLFADHAGRPGQMPVREGITPPDCLRHFGTTWMLVSRSGAAFVMDVGSHGVLQQIKDMLSKGDIKTVDGLWVTHYHYDHTDGIPGFQQEFDCPCYTDRRLAEVLVNPRAWRLPCLAPEPIQVHRPMEDGESWTWREFKMTSYYYPGQTLYHSALLVESDGLRMFFVGDSHTMSGIDDYCAYNRNWLGRDVGFQYCLSLIEKLQPTHIFNCHVNDAFTFTPEEIGFMQKNLTEREALFGELAAWDHANYAMDASWVRCHPYTQKVKSGEDVNLQVIITNHSTQNLMTGCRPVLPKPLGGENTAWITTDALAKEESRLALTIRIPPKTKPGRYVVPVDIKHGPWHLPQFAEAIIDVH